MLLLPFQPACSMLRVDCWPSAAAPCLIPYHARRIAITHQAKCRSYIVASVRLKCTDHSTAKTMNATVPNTLRGSLHYQDGGARNVLITAAVHTCILCLVLYKDVAMMMSTGKEFVCHFQRGA